MAHLRVFLSTQAFSRLRTITDRNRRDVSTEASLILEAALLGVDLDPNETPTLVSIQRRAAIATMRGGAGPKS